MNHRVANDKGGRKIQNNYKETIFNFPQAQPLKLNISDNEWYEVKNKYKVIQLHYFQKVKIIFLPHGRRTLIFPY